MPARPLSPQVPSFSRQCRVNKDINYSRSRQREGAAEGEKEDDCREEPHGSVVRTLEALRLTQVLVGGRNLRFEFFPLPTHPNTLNKPPLLFSRRDDGGKAAARSALRSAWSGSGSAQDRCGLLIPQTLLWRSWVGVFTSCLTRVSHPKRGELLPKFCF